MRAVAAALLVAAACGGEVAPPPVGGDAAAPGDSAVAAPITVRVRSIRDPIGVPERDVPVAFIAPDGAATVVVTDADGVASATMPSGTAVAIARTVFGSREVTWFLGVPAGAELSDGGRLLSSNASSPLLGPRRLLLAPFNGFMRFATSCGGVGQAFDEQHVVWEQPDCARASDATIVAVTDNDDGAQLFTARAHVDLRGAEPVAMPPWRPMVAGAVTLTSMPTDAVEATVLLTQEAPDAQWHQVLASASVEGASVVVPLPMIDVATRSRFEIAVRALDHGNLRLFRTRDGAPSRSTVDVGAAAPPWITPLEFSTADRTATWAYQGGGGRRPDVVVATMFFSPDPNRPELRVIASGAATSFTIPPLPSELAAWDFTAASLLFGLGGFGFEITGLAGMADTASRVNQAAREGERTGRGLTPPADPDHDWWLTSP